MEFVLSIFLIVIAFPFTIWLQTGINTCLIAKHYSKWKKAEKKLIYNIYSKIIIISVSIIIIIFICVWFISKSHLFIGILTFLLIYTYLDAQRDRSKERVLITIEFLEERYISGKTEKRKWGDEHKKAIERMKRKEKENIFSIAKDKYKLLGFIKFKLKAVMPSIFLTVITIYIILLILYQSKNINVINDVLHIKNYLDIEIKKPDEQNFLKVLTILQTIMLAIGAGCFSLLGVMMGGLAIASTLLSKIFTELKGKFDGIDFAIEQFTAAGYLMVLNIIVSLLFYLFSFTQFITSGKIVVFILCLFIVFFLFFICLFYTRSTFETCFKIIIYGTDFQEMWIEEKSEKSKRKFYIWRKIEF
ncbi:hypothetical protein [Peribacillus simplex]|uniref:hypothetical protein n=1 Tax=Peribacillus simplex TaxID=1478 RepID=UPI0033354DA3